MDNMITAQCRGVGQHLIELYLKDHTILKGTNGPYDDPETRVRNLCHLCVITAIEAFHFQETKYVSALRDMGDDLLCERDSTGLFFMREKQGKDISNGVIGHAWAMEGLTYLYKVLGEERFLEAIRTISEKHEFDSKLGLWNCPIYGTNKKRIDFTLNHQLWYAASLAEANVFLKDQRIGNEIEVFTQKFNNNFSTTYKGRIHHEVFNRVSKAEYLKRNVKRLKEFLFEHLGLPSVAYKEEGYHVFNLAALARLHGAGVDLGYRNRRIKKALEYCSSDEIKRALLSEKLWLDNTFVNHISELDEKKINVYGYPYNVPGFELLYIDRMFEGLIDEAVLNYHIRKQMCYTYDAGTGTMGRSCHDKNTVNYRVYEYYRYLEVIDEKRCT